MTNAYSGRRRRLSRERKKIGPIKVSQCVYITIINMCSVPARVVVFTARAIVIALHSFSAETSEITPNRGIFG